MDRIPAGFFALLGLIIGSFLNVCIYRLPKGESLVWPGSHCPDCGRKLSALDLVPVLSWLALRGKCRTCGSRISGRYPMVEAFTGIVFYWAAANAAGSPLNFLNSVLFLSGLTVVFFIDLDHLIIPDKVVLPLAVIGLALGLFPWEAGHKVFLSRLEGAAAGFFGFWAIAEAGTYMLRFEDKLGTEIGNLLLFTRTFYKGETDVPRDAMGGGDIKLAAMMGAFLGLKLLGVGLFIAFLIGSVLAVGLILSGKRGAKDAVPFGPMMAAGGAIALVKGEALVQWYAGFIAGLWGL